MARSKKRKAEPTVDNTIIKIRKRDAPVESIKHPVLSCYYDKILSLRQYFLAHLQQHGQKYRHAVEKFKVKHPPENSELDKYLDTVIVGLTRGNHTSPNIRQTDLDAFTQQLPPTIHSTLGQNVEPDDTMQREVVNFVIWSIFRRTSGRPSHLLAQGYVHAGAPLGINSSYVNATAGLPGLVCQYPNGFVDTVTNTHWCKLLQLLGKGGDMFMAGLLLDCAIFVPLESGQGNYYQLSGLPLSNVAMSRKILPHEVKDVKSAQSQMKPGNLNTNTPKTLTEPRKLVDIRFVRHRILYAKPALNQSGSVKFGLRHIHVFNRYAKCDVFDQDVHIAKYIFPRQFGLHNVFTSTVDSRETSQQFKDYTIREPEIEAVEQKSSRKSTWLPKRLRGAPIQLISTIRRRHKRLPYIALLKQYCEQDVPIHTIPSDQRLSGTSSKTRPGRRSSQPGKQDLVEPAARRSKLVASLQGVSQSPSSSNGLRASGTNLQVITRPSDASKRSPRHAIPDVRQAIAHGESVCRIETPQIPTNHGDTATRGNAHAHHYLSSVRNEQSLYVAGEAGGFCNPRNSPQPRSQSPGDNAESAPNSGLELGHTSGSNVSGPVAAFIESGRVSRYVLAVCRRLLPPTALGSDHNRRGLFNSIARFIHARKFESLSLHEVMQTVRISDIPWLKPSSCTGNISKSDFEKRKELFAEFVYWLFDSFVIPLIRSSFHVTESSDDKNKLYYYRHDVWKRLTEPTMLELKTSMFQELKPETARKLFASRVLGYSNIRLVPKATGFRPIMNLRRRPEYISHGKRLLGRSINSILRPSYNALRHEAVQHPCTLGRSLTSVDGIQPVLQRYQAQLKRNGLQDQPLYFAKVDVQACFDSIPQEKVLAMVKELMRSDLYALSNSAQVRRPQIITRNKSPAALKPKVKFQREGHPAQNVTTAYVEAEKALNGRQSDTVFIGNSDIQLQPRRALYQLLDQHIQNHVVKIGKKYYRQKKGIPQGSVVSSLLCNLFYSALEAQDLSFIKQPSTTLLRLIDDFLLVSTDKAIAVKFLDIMHAGIADFGITVKSEKSLVNFDVNIQGHQVSRSRFVEFPYCGLTINTTTLHIARDIAKADPKGIANTLSVETSILPGKSFRQKALNALRMQIKAFLFNTSFNSLTTVLSNIYFTFHNTALRIYHYIRNLSTESRPPASLIIRTIDDLISLANSILRRRAVRAAQQTHDSQNKSYSDPIQEFSFSIRKDWLIWIACSAFKNVIERRQTGYKGVLVWLEEKIGKYTQRGAEGRLLSGVVRDGEKKLLDTWG